MGRTRMRKTIDVMRGLTRGLRECNEHDETLHRLNGGGFLFFRVSVCRRSRSNPTCSLNAPTAGDAVSSSC